MQTTSQKVLRKTNQRAFSSALVKKMEQKIPESQQKLIAFRKEHANTKIGDITVGSVIGGMRGMMGMLYETSKLHHIDGINYRGKDLYEIRKNGPKTLPGGEPNPEGMFWLLLTGEYPNEEEIADFRREIFERGALTAEQEKLIKAFPSHMHPMTQLSAGTLVCQPESKFVKAYQGGIHKSKLWEASLEDTLDLCAKVSRIAALVYNNNYGNGKAIADRDANLDYSANYCRQLGFEDEKFWELMRLYLVIHADHEGGNVSAHTNHLVGSALADPYLSYSAAMCGLAAPLHGLANQECLAFAKAFIEKYGEGWTEEDIKNHVHETLGSGKVVPGYGHAVLRKTDPRFVVQMDFAEANIKDDNLIDLIRAFYKVIPVELGSIGKIQNPWPNVDAASGGLIQHFGLTQEDYYTVLFGVSRCFGVASAGVWSRALGLPIERPNSATIDHLINMANK